MFDLSLINNSCNLLWQNKNFIVHETAAKIKSLTLVPNGQFFNYQYIEEKCYRDLKYVVDGYYYDLKNFTDRKTNFNAAGYWEDGVPQVRGTMEIEAHLFLKDLLCNYVMRNIAVDNPLQTIYKQVFTGVVVTEDIIKKLDDLCQIIIDVIANGPQSLPEMTFTSASIFTDTDLHITLPAQLSTVDTMGYNQKTWDLSRQVSQTHIDHWIDQIKHSPSPQDEGLYDVYFITDRNKINALYEESWHECDIPERAIRSKQLQSNLVIVFVQRNTRTFRTHHFSYVAKPPSIWEKAVKDTNTVVGIISTIIANDAITLGYKTALHRCNDLFPNQKNNWCSILGIDISKISETGETPLIALSIGYEQLDSNNTNEYLILNDDRLYPWENSNQLIKDRHHGLSSITCSSEDINFLPNTPIPYTIHIIDGVN